MRPEPQLFWKILQAPPLKMNRQIFGPELDDERREELDTLEELETPADLDELGERDELDGPGTVMEIEDMALPLRDAERTHCVSRTRKARR